MIRVTGDSPDPDWFRLRGELVQLGLFQGFDELLCLPLLRGVETHWYQVETVRKVLKQYRGRVLLADEVGLGKTIEAGMVVKEYMLRGMAERVLILTPASLVGQWREEMAEKFGIDCATTHDRLLRDDPAAFWAQHRVIASMAVARRKDHAALLAAQAYDVVVVDEAHHLKDQSSASYHLVNSLQKRFLLLLSATPVQNNLIELYNLLTLLQPGIFKTQKEFRAAYMVHGKPREPVNREKLRDLMRGVMIRNTRALAALRLPRRHAATLRATPEPEEAACYRDLTAKVRAWRRAGSIGWRRSICCRPPDRPPPLPRWRSPGSANGMRRTKAGPRFNRAISRWARVRSRQPARSAATQSSREEDGVRASSRQPDASRRLAAGARHEFRHLRRIDERAGQGRRGCGVPR